MVAAMLTSPSSSAEATRGVERVEVAEVELQESPTAKPATGTAEPPETETAEPTNTRTRTPTRIPTLTPQDTATPRPTSTPRPTNTPHPTNTRPLVTPVPTQTPVRAATIAVPLPTATVAPLPTAVPPTSMPTAIPPTAVPPTSLPQPTATLQATSGLLVIIGVNKDAEYVDIRNDGGGTVDLSGWILRSEKGNQDCALGGSIGAGQVLRIWAMAEDAGQGGFNCGFDSNIWNNSESDPAVLINPSGQEVSRR